MPGKLNTITRPALERHACQFLATVNEVGRMGRAVAPAHAASLGLILEWNAWVDALEGRDGMSHSEFRLRPGSHDSVDEVMEAGHALFCEAMETLDPNYLSAPAVRALLGIEHLYGSVDVASMAAFYLHRPHTVVEPTAALQTWLLQTDVGDNVPASLFQLPAPATFLRVGPEIARVLDAPLWPPSGIETTTHGIYLFDTHVDGIRHISFVAIGTSDQRIRQSLYLFLGLPDQTRSLIDVARETRSHDSYVGDPVAVVEICAKVLLYMQTADSACIEERLGDELTARLARVQGKKAARLERQMATHYNRIIVGPAQITSQGHGEVAPHWRQGHLRMQPHGPQNSLRKLIFIAPTVVRADRLA